MTLDPRVSKSIEQKIAALDEHLFLLRLHLQGLRDSPSHLKVISAELRTLVCLSSKVEGLLWRLTHELAVDDGVHLNLAGDFDLGHPLAQSLSFAIAPMTRGDQAHPAFVPNTYSLKEVIKRSQAVLTLGKPLTHETLISAVAQQMGTAHEADKVSPEIDQLSSIFVNGVEPFVHVLETDAQLVLEVGERVLEMAEKKDIFARKRHSYDYGNMSVVVRLHIKKLVSEPVRILRLYSHVSRAEIQYFLTPEGLLIRFSKRGVQAAELVATFPEAFDVGCEIMHVFSYASHAQKIKTVTGGDDSEIIGCELDWIHGADFQVEPAKIDDLFDWVHILTFGRLLSSAEVRQLMEPDAGGLFITEDRLAAQGPFPE
jgi:hypothetical protein